jgi:hypothetical protein
MSKNKCLVIVGVVVVIVVLLAILYNTVLANHRPIITSLEAQPERVTPRGSCQIVCNATDPDGDELVYGWSASGGGMTGEGATITWTAPASVGAYNATVTVVDGHGGGVVEHVTITVRANRPPTINSLTADADWTTPSGSLQIMCDATDTDHDELSYEWSVTGGDISGTGLEVVWTAPEQVGVYNITVKVTDAHGSSDTRSLPASVATGQPPIIEELAITKDRYGHCYLKKYSGGYYVGKEQMYDIECIISDAGSGLVYEWSCTGGEISGEGPLIAWVAPTTVGKVTVTVIVSDITGNMVSKNIILNVVSCSTCTFGSCSSG